MSSNKLFVGNLSFNTTENDLQDTFAAHGTVVEANLMVDRVSGRPRGFAFVTMETIEGAKAAVQILHCQIVGGTFITVSESHSGEESRTALPGNDRTPRRSVRQLY